MPNWTDDDGNCHFEIDGVPCCESRIGCPAHRRRKPKKSTATEAAYRRGAEAMREAAAGEVSSYSVTVTDPLGRRVELGADGLGALADAIRALPVPGDEP